MSVSSSIAKSGWLYRQSSVLKKWRRYWFTLTQDGLLRYFETELSSKAEDVMNVPLNCTSIKTGTEVAKVHPPEGMSTNFLLKIETRNVQSWMLCGEDEDDMRAWQLALQEARLIRHHVRSPSAPPFAPPFGAVYQTNAPVRVVTADDMAVRHVYTSYPAGSVNYTIPGAVYYAGYPQGARYTYVYRY